MHGEGHRGFLHVYMFVFMFPNVLLMGQFLIYAFVTMFINLPGRN